VTVAALVGVFVDLGVLDTVQDLRHFRLPLFASLLLICLL
jgi:hypothetical protein